MKIKPFVIWRKGLALFRIIFESNFFIFMIFIIFNLAECSSMMTHDWKTTGHKNRLKHIKRSNKNSLRLWSKIMVKYMFVQMLFDLHKNWSYFIMASFAILLEHLDWLLYTNGFFCMGHYRPLFLYFRPFNTVDSKRINVQYKSLEFTGFEPVTSGVGSDRSTNWATTTAHQRKI